MSKIFINLPNHAELRGMLEQEFNAEEELQQADIVIAENDELFAQCNMLIIVTSEVKDLIAVYVDDTQNIQNQLCSIKCAVAAFSVIDRLQLADDKTAQIKYLVNKLENILNAAAESILEIDDSGRIIFYNKKFVDTYGTTTGIPGGDIFSIFDESTSNNLKAVLKSVYAKGSIEFAGKLIKPTGEALQIEGHISSLPSDISKNYEIIFEDVTLKLKNQLQIKKLEERAIVAGFSRHLSHNVMNALTAAGGFIKQIKQKTVNDQRMQNLWHIIDGKLLLIEEIVAGYNDYTHAISLKTTEDLELSAYFQELILQIESKNVDRNFAAYLYRFTDSYTITYDFSKSVTFTTKASKMFLKLALCYIIKDNIRYFGTGEPLHFDISLGLNKGRFAVFIKVLGVEVSQHVLDTMFQPWNHQILSQSFDYWGVVIANAILEKHNGAVHLQKIDNGLQLILAF